MHKDTACVEVSSSDELRAVLASHAARNSTRFVAVRVFGPRILTRPFAFPRASEHDLLAGLRLEAAEVLSVAVGEIELAYQVLDAGKEEVRGIFSAMSRQDLSGYLDCFKTSHLIPVSLAAAGMAGALDTVRQDHSAGADVCVVGFLRLKTVNITVFSGGEPALFREVYDAGDSDLEEKIRDAIRYVCSHSKSKKIDRILFTGDLSGKDELIARFKSFEPSSGDSSSVAGSARVMRAAVPDLFTSYVLSYERRAFLIRVLTAIAAIALIGAGFLCGYALDLRAQLRRAQETFDVRDYQKALGLQAQMEHMSHDK